MALYSLVTLTRLLLAAALVLERVWDAQMLLLPEVSIAAATSVGRVYDFSSLGEDYLALILFLLHEIHSVLNLWEIDFLVLDDESRDFPLACLEVVLDLLLQAIHLALFQHHAHHGVQEVEVFFLLADGIG